MEEFVRILHFVAGFAITAGVYAIFTLGLNVQWGYTGLFNIGIAGFFAIGAYTSALVTTPLPSGALEQYVQQAIGLDLPFVVGLVAAGLVSGLLAIPIGLPTLRLRADYLAIATIGIAETIRRIFNNERWLANGPQGMIGLAQPLGDLVPSNRYNFVYLGIVLVVLALVYWALERGIRSPWGRVLRAVREDEVVTGSLGKDVFGFKMQSLVLGAVIMGIGGALYAHSVRTIQPGVFTPLFGTFIIWAMLIVGGSGNNKGAVVGAFVVWTIWATMGLFIDRLVPVAWSSRAPFIRLLVIGLLLVGILLRRPQGILGEEKHVSEMM